MKAIYWTAVIFLSVTCTLGAWRIAADPAAATNATTQPTADKNQYNLFHPTPSNLLRGMDTDRPNTTNTPTTIDAGHVQIETGVVDYTFFHHSGFRSDDAIFGQFNFRVGILDPLELNVVINSFEIDREHDDITGRSSHGMGFGDTVLGGKLNLWGNEIGERPWQTSLGIQPQFKIPTADRDVGNGRFECSVAFPFLMNLPEGFHLSLQTGLLDERSSANSGYVTGWQNAVALDRNLIGKLDVYVEYAVEATTEKHTLPLQTLDVGYSYPLNDNLMLDTGLFFGLNKVSPNVEVTAGFTVRF